MSFSTALVAQDIDPVKMANQADEKKASQEIVSEEVADFLVKSADARMMDAKEGQLAAERATSQAIRDYGKLMVKDQAILLQKIQVLAVKKKVTLPSDISNKKEEGREDLSKESGKDFDDKFIKMITIDHERDVKLFKKAIDLDDGDVKAFAKKIVPMIQSHLDKINAIKKAL